MPHLWNRTKVSAHTDTLQIHLSQTGGTVILQPDISKTAPGTLLNQTANGSVATWKFLLRTLEDPQTCRSSLTWTVQSSKDTTSCMRLCCRVGKGNLDVLYNHRSSLLSISRNLTYKTHGLRFSPCKTPLGIWMLSFAGKLLKNSSSYRLYCWIMQKKYKKISNNLEYDARMTKENSCLVEQCLIYCYELFFSRQSGKKRLK